MKNLAKVVLEGRSIKTNVEIAIRAGLVEVRQDTVIQGSDIKDYPADRVVVLSTVLWESNCSLDANGH